MWKRLVLLAAALAVSVPVSIAVAAAPAYASAPPCGSAVQAHWSTQTSYNYRPGGWCMTDGPGEVVWQSDGNLVWYASNGHVFWASGTCVSCTWTSNTGAYKLSFQVDGNIVIYNTRGQALWAIGAADRRTSATNFYWKLYEIPQSCGFLFLKTIYDLDHYQIEPSNSYDLHNWSRCY